MRVPRSLAVGVFALWALSAIEPIDANAQPGPPRGVAWRGSLEDAQREAAHTGRSVLVYFWGPYCGYCKQMEQQTFTDPRVIETINRAFVPVKVNQDQSPQAVQNLGVKGLPTTLVLTPDGQVLDRLQGKVPADALTGRLTALATRGIDRTDRTTPAVASRPRRETVGAGPGGSPAAQPNPSPRYHQAPHGQAPATDYRRPMADPRYAGRNRTVPPVERGRDELAAAGPHSAPPQGRYAGYRPGAAPERYAAPQGPTNAGPRPPIAQQQPQQQPTGYQRRGMNPAPPESAARGANPPIAGHRPGYGPATPPEQPNQPDQPEQPEREAGNPPLALDGYCAVSLIEDIKENQRQWTLGSKKHGVIHRGRTYLFANAEKAQRFFENPDRFAPVLSGNDVVVASEEGRLLKGKREHGAFFGERIYLFSSEETLKQFENNPNRYAGAAHQAVQTGAFRGRMMR